jgi:hypothetical protein
VPFFMVGVAQLVECKIVILVVVGSIPIVHPILIWWLLVDLNKQALENRNRYTMTR